MNNGVTEALLDHANRRHPKGLIPQWRGTVRADDASIETTSLEERTLAKAATRLGCPALAQYHLVLANRSGRLVSWERRVERAVLAVERERGS